MRHNATPDIDLLSDQSYPDLELPPDLDPVTGDTLSDPYPIPDDEQERDRRETEDAYVAERIRESLAKHWAMCVPNPHTETTEN